MEETPQHLDIDPKFATTDEDEDWQEKVAWVTASLNEAAPNLTGHNVREAKGQQVQPQRRNLTGQSTRAESQEISCLNTRSC